MKSCRCGRQYPEGRGPCVWAVMRAQETSLNTKALFCLTKEGGFIVFRGESWVKKF